MIKKYWWYAVAAIGLVVVAVFFRDTALGAAVQSFLRKKRVEDEVNAIKDKIASKDAKLAYNDEKMVILAEELANAKVDAKTASDKEIQDFYANLFKNN